MNNRQLIEKVQRFVQSWSLDTSQTASSILNPILDTLPPDDRPKLTATVSDLLRHWILLKEVIKPFSRIKTHKLHPHLASLIQIAVYQLLFDPTIPDHAVLHAAVSLCIPHQKGYANGLLRTIARQKTEIINELIPALPLWYQKSFPQPFIDQLTQTFPHHPVSDLLDYLNTEPVFHTIPIQEAPATPRTTNTDAFLSFPRSPVDRKAAQLPLQEDLRKHKTWVQNISSQFLSYFAVYLKAQRILDLCAAPGSKSSLISWLSPEIQIVAQDLSLPRLGRLQQRMNATPLTFPNLALCCADARSPTFADRFDLIMLDAPCSALGTVRKHPDRRYDCSEERILALADQQFSMLIQTLKHYAGAPVLYSVCTFTMAETEGLMERLQASGMIDPKKIAEAMNLLEQALKCSGLPFQKSLYGAYILPDRNLDTDLFFIALLPPGRS